MLCGLTFHLLYLFVSFHHRLAANVLHVLGDSVLSVGASAETITTSTIGLVEDSVRILEDVAESVATRFANTRRQQKYPGSGDTRSGCSWQTDAGRTCQSTDSKQKIAPRFRLDTYGLDERAEFEHLEQVLHDETKASPLHGIDPTNVSSGDVLGDSDTDGLSGVKAEIALAMLVCYLTVLLLGRKDTTKPNRRNRRPGRITHRIRNGHQQNTTSISIPPVREHRSSESHPQTLNQSDRPRWIFRWSQPKTTKKEQQGFLIGFRILWLAISAVLHLVSRLVIAICSIRAIVLAVVFCWAAAFLSNATERHMAFAERYVSTYRRHCNRKLQTQPVPIYYLLGRTASCFAFPLSLSDSLFIFLTQ